MVTEESMPRWKSRGLLAAVILQTAGATALLAGGMALPAVRSMVDHERGRGAKG